MPDLDVVPFADEHLEAAASLLAERHARHRVAEPLLAEVDARTGVEEAWRLPGTTGVLALRGDEPVGYLIAALEGELPIWGNLAWVERAGHAARDAEIAREVYAGAAEAWVAAGAIRHYVLVPAIPAELDPWYRLGFAHMHVEAIRESAVEPRTLPKGVTIRRGGPDDLGDAISIDRLIQELQGASPSFSFEAATEDRREMWVETLADREVTYLVAERDGRAIGHATLYPRSEFGTPKDSLYVASTATLEAVRGTGVGVALVEHALERAREQGYASVNTNWRMTNLLASRFWPARGFRPFFHRLHRAIGLG